MMCGSAVRLWYQCGWVGAPPRDATSAYLPSCSTRISAILRTFPDDAPRMVTTMTGIPVSRSVVARVPPDASYSATCSRTQSSALGSYSPSIGMSAKLPRMDHHRAHQQACRLTACALTALIVVAVAPAAAVSAGTAPPGSPEQELADRYAPVMMLQAQEHECDVDGEPFDPMDVEGVLDNPQVA